MPRGAPRLLGLPLRARRSPCGGGFRRPRAGLRRHTPPAPGRARLRVSAPPGGAEPASRSARPHAISRRHSPAPAGAPCLCEHLLAVAQTPGADQLGLNTAAPTTLVVDLNCAFASIEQQHDPSLRGRPLAIAAYATNAATIVSSSREARDLGIKTGMKVFEAKAIFPKVAVMEPNPPRYREVSDRLMEIIERHTPDVLRMSIDEASLNLVGTPDLVRLGTRGVGLAIKKALREEVGECVTCSVGISTCLLYTSPSPR